MTASAPRALGALDLDIAARLHGRAFAPLGERAWTRQEIAELLATPGVKGLVVGHGEDGVGFALWRVAADEAELLTIAVSPDRRRAGAGAALLAAVIAGAREAGATRLLLEVGEDNQAARALYEAAGFSTTGRRAAYYERGAKPRADALVMRPVIGS